MKHKSQYKVIQGEVIKTMNIIIKNEVKWKIMKKSGQNCY